MSSRSYADQSKLAQAIYITVSKACGCTLDRCQAGDWVVEKVFVGDKKALLKRIDFSTERDAAKEYITKYRLAMPPSLLFLDKDGNLLWRADGELDLGPGGGEVKRIRGLTDPYKFKGKDFRLNESHLR